jgi:hypothetical protein
MHASESSGAHLNTQRLYFIAEATKFPNHSCRAASLRFLAYGRASFLVADPLVQNGPNQSTEPMRNCSDGLPMSQARLCVAKTLNADGGEGPSYVQAATIQL